MYIPKFTILIINSLSKSVFDRRSQCRKLFQLWEYCLVVYISLRWCGDTSISIVFASFYRDCPSRKRRFVQTELNTATIPAMNKYSTLYNMISANDSFWVLETGG